MAKRATQRHTANDKGRAGEVVDTGSLLELVADSLGHWTILKGVNA